ncbi:MAG: hypothetical protein PF445_04600 [Melioribacteraceae bacterium]|jgi:hypothetical protein|nr:hypothetical protein [Melioribacteraceae bacterium]
MEQYIAVFVFFVIALGLMLGSLKFSKYKERPGATCGGDSCACEASGEDKSECTKEEEITNKFLIDVDKI